MTRLLSQGYKSNRLSNTFKKFYCRQTNLLGQYKENVSQMFADFISKYGLHYICHGRTDKISKDSGCHA